MTKATTVRRPRHHFWMFALLGLIFSYLSLLGMTFSGVITLIELQPTTLGLLGLMAASWLVIHWWRGWTWHRTPLDPVFVLWVIAFAVSILANLPTWRRSAEALWYMALYIGMWYLLLDVLANGGLSRQVFAQALLFAGFSVMLFAWYQVWILLRDPAFSGIPRPSSLIGNANAFGAFMLILLPFSIVQAVNASRRLPQIIMGLYTISAFTLLILSQSRAAWVGAVCGLGLLVILLLADKNLLSFNALRSWWHEQSGTVRIGLIVGAIVLLLVGMFMAYYLLNSLSDRGRSLYLRTYLWSVALQMFRDHPLTGTGLFTYGQHLPYYASIPPTQPQAHAHNVPLTMAAEMGLLGVLAVLLTVGVVLWTMFRNWRELSASERPYFIASAAAVIGFGVHHLLDTPAMMPLIALTGLLVLALAVAPHEPQAIQAMWRKVGHPIGLFVIWSMLIAAGFWNIHLNAQYISILRTVTATDIRAVKSGDYRHAAEAMQSLVDADPRQPAYVLQQAYLYGMVAASGDLETADFAIERYQRYVELEPTHAVGWANLAALYWQVDNQAGAQMAIEQTIRFAPDWPHFQRQREIYTGILTDAETIDPPLSPFQQNWSLLQYLRQPLDGYLPQVGWGSP